MTSIRVVTQAEVRVGAGKLMRERGFATIALGLTLAACGGGGGGAAGGQTSSGPPQPAPAPVPVPDPFADATAASNISYEVAYTRGLETLRVEESSFGGAAAGDCDADGDIDLFITYGDRGPNRLYMNQLIQGTGVALQFQDNAVAAGVANTRTDGQGNDRHSGPIMADLDGDGDLDLFVGGLLRDPNKVYRNRGDCTFEDVSAGSGIERLSADNTFSAALGDYDLDGDLDLFLTHWDSADEFPVGGETEHLFRNVSDDAAIRFENVSAASRVTEHLIGIRAYSTQSTAADYSFTPSFARINDDAWPDIAIAGDYGTTQLLISEGASGTFIDATNDAVHSVQYGMGSALGDYDADGDLDWFVTAYFGTSVNGERMTGNRLFQNPGGDFSVERLVNVTTAARVADGGWGWGACFLDIDNDTDLDIYHTNGWAPVLYPDELSRDRSVAFVSNGAGVFTEQANALGLDDEHNGRGVVCADFDNDGDMDILQLTNKSGNSAALWENSSAAAGMNSLRVRLIGLPPNTEAAGARIHVRITDSPGAATQMREVMIGNNYTSQNPAVQLFGLGTNTTVAELKVEWPFLVAAGGGLPVNPADTILTSVLATGPGETVVLCHPGLGASTELDALCANR